MKTQILIFVLFVTTCLYSTIINIPGDQPTIQAGINVAADSDTVLVQPGTYVENINYNGKLITVGSLFLTTQDTTYIAQTIIDGNQNGGVVGFVNGETMDAVLTGFTITNGNSPTSGGGISCVYGSNPRLENLLITGNSAEYNGGGIICGAYASPSIVNVTITGNSAGSTGGGIYCFNYSNPSLENVIISNNTSHNGGGICCFENCTLNLDYVEITNNSATSDGGGILCAANSNLNLQNVTITENSAADEGGGIYILGSSPILENVIISGNSAVDVGGGLLCMDSSSPSLENVIITGNSAYIGGGINCSLSSNPYLINVLIAGNSADAFGGGISCYEASPTLVNVTIVDNTANEGCGIYCREYSDPELIDCILWNNSPVNIFFDIDGEPNNISISYSDIQGGEAGIVTNNNGTINWLEGNIVEDPLFTGTGLHPFSLQNSSLCINAGIPDITGLNLPEFDLAGNPRMYGGRIDMGAYENQNVAVSSEEIIIPNVTTLYQNFPNPFNPSTTINYSLKENSKVNLNIYNIKGQKVRQLVSNQLTGGQHSVVWNGKDDNNKPVSSGIYFYKLKTDNFDKTRKMILMK